MAENASSVPRPSRQATGAGQSLGSADQRVLALVDGARTIGAIASTIGQPEDAMHAALKRLRLAGLVLPESAPAASAPAPPQAQTRPSPSPAPQPLPTQPKPPSPTPRPAASKPLEDATASSFTPIPGAMNTPPPGAAGPLFGARRKRKVSPRGDFDRATEHEESIPAVDYEGDFDAALVRENLDKTFKYLHGRNYFELIEVHESSSQEEIDEGVQKRIVRLKLDRYLKSDRVPEDVKEIARKIIHLVEQAYEAIKDPAKRVTYRREVFGDLNLSLEAEVQYKKGDIYLFWKREPENAVPWYRSALDLYDKNSDYHAALGLALYRADRRNLSEALACIKKAIQMSPGRDVPHLYYGMILGDERNPQAARKEILEALRLNPGNIEAKKALAELGRRSGEVDL